MALFIFGAGATRGCSFVEAQVNPCLPPLDRDFFTQLQRIGNRKHRDLIHQVMQDVVKMFGQNFDVTMETVFTTLEHTIRMVSTTGESRDFRRAELDQMKTRLQQGIAAVFEDSLLHRGSKGRLTRRVRTCKHHKMFVKEILKPGDDIITFNYDCMLDTALKQWGSGKWNPHYGYGFKLGPRGTRLSGYDFWTPKRVAGRQTTASLFKLHGSLHFDIENEEDEDSAVKLKQRPYTRQGGDLRFSIIPPEWTKAYHKGVFATLWRGAADAIHRATECIFIGYSLPATDMHSTALFRTAIKRNSLNSLVVVNPDSLARKRIRSVVLRGLSTHSRVLSLERFSELVRVPRRTWDFTRPEQTPFRTTTNRVRDGQTP